MRSPAVLSIILLAGCFASGQTVTVAPQQREVSAPSLRTAQAQVRSGQIASAEVTLRLLLEQDPGDAEALVELGTLEQRLQRFPEADATLRRAVAAAPGNARAHYVLGLSMVVNPANRLDWPGAIAEFRIALKLRPDYADALTYLGAGLLATAQPDQAVAALRQAVAVDSASASAWFNLALALEALGRDADALPAYRQAIALRVPYPEASSALGKLEERTGGLPTAEADFRAALRANPDLQDAHQALGRLLRTTHRLEEAKLEFAEVAALAQREPDGIAASQLSNAALESARQGQISAGIAMLRRAILLRPDYGVAHHNLGLLLADQRDLGSAVQELSVAVSLLPGQGRTYFDLARVLELLGRTPEAAACLRWAAALSPGEPRYAAELRALPAEVQRGDLARPFFGAAADTPEGHEAFARDLHRQGEAAAEAGELLRALSLAPASVSARTRLAAAYRSLGDTAKAGLEDRKLLLVIGLATPGLEESAARSTREQR